MHVLYTTAIALVDCSHLIAYIAARLLLKFKALVKMANPLAALGRALVGGAVGPKPPAQDVFGAIRNDDPAGVTEFLARGVDINAPGPVRFRFPNWQMMPGCLASDTVCSYIISKILVNKSCAC
jgi:hypothetical protein